MRGCLTDAVERGDSDRLMVVLRDDRPHQRSHDADDHGGAEDYVEDDYEGHINSFSGFGEDQTGLEDRRRSA